MKSYLRAIVLGSMIGSVPFVGGCKSNNQIKCDVAEKSILETEEHLVKNLRKLTDYTHMTLDELLELGLIQNEDKKKEALKISKAIKENKDSVKSTVNKTIEGLQLIEDLFKRHNLLDLLHVHPKINDQIFNHLMGCRDYAFITPLGSQSLINRIKEHDDLVVNQPNKECYKSPNGFTTTYLEDLTNDLRVVNSSFPHSVVLLRVQGIRKQELK